MFEYSDIQQNCQDFYVETLSHVSAFWGSYNAGADFRIPLPPSHPSSFRYPGQTVLWALVRNQFPLSRNQNLVQEIRRECELPCDSVIMILLSGTGLQMTFTCDSVPATASTRFFVSSFLLNSLSQTQHQTLLTSHPFSLPFLAAHHKNSFLIGSRSVGSCPPYSASSSSPFLYSLSPNLCARRVDIPQ